MCHLISHYLIPPFLPHAVVWLLAGWMLPTAAHSLAHSLAGSLDNSLILFPFPGDKSKTSNIFHLSVHGEAKGPWRPTVQRSAAWPRASCVAPSVVTAPRCASRPLMRLAGFSGLNSRKGTFCLKPLRPQNECQRMIRTQMPVWTPVANHGSSRWRSCSSTSRRGGCRWECVKF